jgi:hypothetical protein
MPQRPVGGHRSRAARAGYNRVSPSPPSGDRMRRANRASPPWASRPAVFVLPFALLLVAVLTAPPVARAESATATGTTEAPAARLLRLPLGGKTIEAPLPDGYIVLDDAPDYYRDLMQRVIPPRMRMLEVILFAEDLDLEMEEFSRSASFELYANRDIENLPLSAAEWAIVKKEAGRELRRADVASRIRSSSERSAERLNKAMQEEYGDVASLEIGKPGEQVVYREDERSLRMYLVLPTRQSVLEEVHEIDMVRVVALTHVRNRMLCVVGSLEFPKGKADVPLVLRQLDAYLDEIHRLNPAEEPAADRG